MNETIESVTTERFIDALVDLTCENTKKILSNENRIKLLSVSVICLSLAGYLTYREIKKLQKRVAALENK